MIFDKDNWLEIAGTLKMNKLRSFLTAFGVFWGIFMLIIMVAAGNGLYNGAMHDFQSLAANSVFLWTQPTTLPYKGFPRGRKFNFDNYDIGALRSHIPEIEYLAPRNQLGGFRQVTNVSRRLKNGAFNIYGDYPEIAHISLMDIMVVTLIIGVLGSLGFNSYSKYVARARRPETTVAFRAIATAQKEYLLTHGKYAGTFAELGFNIERGLLISPTEIQGSRYNYRILQDDGPRSWYVVATGNIGCLLQIGSAINIPVVHTVELLDWATGGPKPAALAPAGLANV